MVEVSRLGDGQEDHHLSQGPAKYRPHRPHRSHGADFQGLRAGRSLSCYPPQTIGYRPFLQAPPADRPPGNEPFCRAFSLIMVTAVDAVATFPAFTYGLLIVPRVSFSRGDID